MSATDNQSLLDKIPDPDEIRQRLADNLQESRLLRSMLRVAEKVSRERASAVFNIAEQEAAR
jgi:hypothetical protein